MTGLQFTKHSLDKMSQLGLNKDHVYQLFQTSKKCSVPVWLWIRKQAINHHGRGRVFHKCDDYIMVIARGNILVTIFKADNSYLYN